MITEVFGKLTTGVSEKKSITLKNNGGILIIDVDEDKFTPEMQKQLSQVDFNFYLNDNTDEPKKVVFATKSWNSDLDRAIAFNQVPAASMVEVVVQLDDSYILANNLIPIQEFPIKVSISDENILGKAGGSGAIDEEIDSKISAHNTSSTAHEDIRKLVSKAVKYKGSVKNYSDLPTNPEDGDMYNIENADIEHQINAGDNVVWVADSGIWDNLGGFIDLSQLQVMMDFPAWLTEVTSDPTKTMNDVVTTLDNNVATTGLIYMGGLSVSNLPVNDMVQAETVIEVMKSSNNDPLYKFTVVSTNVPPYLWTATGYNGEFSGWQERPTSEQLTALQTELSEQINTKQDKLTFDETPTENSENPVKSGGVFRALSAKVNTEELDNYVQNTDYASEADAGVIKIGNGFVIIDGVLYVNQATAEDILARTNIYKPIVPANLNAAVKAALSDTNRISDMTDNEKAAAREVIGASGEVDLTDYVKNTDYATASKGGVIKVSPDLGIGIGTAGSVLTTKASDAQIASRINDYVVIVPANLNTAVKAALSDTNRISDMTDEEKSNARGVIGALGDTDLSSYVKNTDYASTSKAGIIRIGAGFKIVNGTTIYPLMATNTDIDARTNEYEPIVPANLDYAVRSVIPLVNTSLGDTIVRNCIYNLGEQTTITLTLPTIGSVGDWLQFDFLSGATATTLTVTSTSGLLGYDLIPEVNTVYSMYLDWGIIGKTDDTLNYGWRFSYSEYPLDE